jgi:hypothetical protein
MHVPFFFFASSCSCITSRPNKKQASEAEAAWMSVFKGRMAHSLLKSEKLRAFPCLSCRTTARSGTISFSCRKKLTKKNRYFSPFPLANGAIFVTLNLENK